MDTNASQPKSAYDKAAEEGVDPRCIPQYLTGHTPVGSEIEAPRYTAQMHANWKVLFDRQKELLPGRAGEAFLQGIDLLEMTPDRIPLLRDLSAVMERETGWRVARIPGLLHEQDFFRLISERTFPSTDYIREAHELDYTPAPDCFHDMFGHMPMLTEPAVADFYHLFGRAALLARGAQRTALERLHWFTIEFGLIRESQGLRVFGAGIMSSSNELTHSLSDDVEVQPFSIEAVTAQEYEVWHVQPILFALSEFRQLVEDFTAWARSERLISDRIFV